MDGLEQPVLPPCRTSAENGVLCDDLNYMAWRLSSYIAFSDSERDFSPLLYRIP